MCLTMQLTMQPLPCMDIPGRYEYGQDDGWRRSSSPNAHTALKLPLPSRKSHALLILLPLAITCSYCPLV
jgi:hypothetical protein